MDKIQKAGLKLLTAGAFGLLVSFGLPLFTTVDHRGLLLALGGAFISSFCVIGSVFMLRNGDATEAMLGPLGSDERRRKVRIYFLIASVPALAVCGLLYFILSQRGYRLIG